MVPRQQTAEKVLFGCFEVNLATGEVFKNGRKLRLSGQPAEVLVILLEHAGRLVTREELRELLWPDETFVDFDHGLNNCINRIRDVLGDAAGSPEWIETLPKKGYRFIAPVRPAEQISQSAPETLETLSEPNGQGKSDLIAVYADGRTADKAATLPWQIDENGFDSKKSGGLKYGSRLRFRIWLLAFAGFLAAGLAATTWYLRRPLPPPRISEYVRITHDGRERNLAGTDGSRLYFTQVSPLSIAQVGITGGEIAQVPISVPGDLAYLRDVSQDGSNFLVASERNGNQTLALWNVRALGGSLRRLGDAIDEAFSPDGGSVAYSTFEGDIYLVRSDGTGARKLASIKGKTDHLAWSPDGATIRFDIDHRLWEMSSSGSNLHPLLPGWQASLFQCCGHWTPDGELFVFLLSDFQQQYRPQGQLWALDERRGLFHKLPAEPIQLTSGPVLWSPPIPSRDGKKIFAGGVTRRGELVRFDSASQRFLPFLGGISADGASFSKDGRFVAYVSFPDGVLWKANSDGSHPVQLSDPPIHPAGPRWSPDGMQIMFMDVSSRSDKSIYVVSSEGGNPHRLLPQDNGREDDPEWSPDGNRVVFAGGRKVAFGAELSKRLNSDNLRILDLTNHRISSIPGSVGMWYPRWSPDGRYIVAKAWDSPRVNIFDIETQRWLAPLLKGDWFWPAWSRDSQFVYFLMLANGDQGLFRIRVKGGEAERVVDLKDLHLTGWSGGGWMDLDPRDAPMLLRDIGSDDIYALTLEWK